MHARRVRNPGDDRRPRRGPAPPTRPRRRVSPASSARPFAAPGDIRRLAAAAASAIVPGLGQLLNGRRRLARWLVVPVAILVGVVVVEIATHSRARLLASVLSPTVLSLLLALNVVVLGWRLFAAAHAFFDGRYAPRSGRLGALGLVVVVLAIAVPHGILNAWGTAAQAAFARIFTSEAGVGPGSNAAATRPGPGPNARLNVLLLGVDSFPGRSETLTDSMMVVSVDPVGGSVSIVSVPRDTVRVPLGDGSVFGPKLNSLLAYADAHPGQFPQGGLRAVEDAVGALLGIPVHYYVKVDFAGFVKLVDAVGGVDVTVARAWYDPTYDGIGIDPKGTRGWGVTVGRHHFDGWEALAYARSRKAPTESDFTRAARQQQILVAIRDRILSDGSALANLPRILDALGGFVTTDLPTDRLPDLAAIADQIGATPVYRMVLDHPLVADGTDPVLGSVEIPDLVAIRAAVAAIMPAPGKVPLAWTPAPAAATPAPSPAPKPHASAKPRATARPRPAPTAP